jgi:hypothetical protein
MINKIHSLLVSLVLVFMVTACIGNPKITHATEAVASHAAETGEVQVLITGGHDTDPRDGGRPVVLIAAALGVPQDVFREAFSHVQPATAGQEPDPAQVQLNKEALMEALGPFGVTNDYLDTVSNYYRYNRSAGETWPQTPATATAVLTNGVITGFEITNPGAGYTTPPAITVLNSDATATAVLSFGTDFNTNGSLAEIILDP